ncbi:GtrA family protein [Paenibacillus dendritiformis]|uniref:GtrA family protein n=1 Tax=Paenibacillus dendritiformis TaxID=130049 RepID=UPI00248C5160|nr:GtrA family protein [Paenibacillus dendritiformis]WGU93824.1 GtrA family protein [Paenibacillus dendritiformis]
MNNQFYKFIVVGGINTLFGYIVFSLFIFIGAHYSLASLLSTIIGVLFNFKTTGSLVFKNNNNKLLLKFCLSYGITYILNILLLSLLKKFFSMYAAAAILIFPMALVSYVLNKRFVFKKRLEV